jgi:hypothetical protein
MPFNRVLRPRLNGTGRDAAINTSASLSTKACPKKINLIDLSFVKIVRKTAFNLRPNLLHFPSSREKDRMGPNYLPYPLPIVSSILPIH